MDDADGINRYQSAQTKRRLNRLTERFAGSSAGDTTKEAMMESSHWAFSPQSKPPAAPGQVITDYRSRLALEQFQAAEVRQQELAEQSSPHNAPEARIRAWERAHRLTLPRDPAHPVLNFVATVTRLSLEQVRDEQRRRAAPPANQAVAVQP